MDDIRGCNEPQLQVDVSALIPEKIKSLPPLVLVLHLIKVRHGECEQTIRTPGIKQKDVGVIGLFRFLEAGPGVTKLYYASKLTIFYLFS